MVVCQFYFSVNHSSLFISYFLKFIIFFWRNDKRQVRYIIGSKLNEKCYNFFMEDDGTYVKLAS